MPSEGVCTLEGRKWERKEGDRIVAGTPVREGYKTGLALVTWNTQTLTLVVGDQCSGSETPGA